MNIILDTPLEVRLLVLFFVGTWIGSVANWAAYTFCRDPLDASPWSRGYPRSGTALWLDRLPLVGWLRARPTGKNFQQAGWLRPFLIEFLSGLAVAGLYLWEIGELKLVFNAVWRVDAAFITTLHLEYLSHVILLAFMIPISLIDIDERQIPDELTVPGTMLGLMLAAILPLSMMPAATVDINMRPGGGLLMNAKWEQHPLHIASPNPWPAELHTDLGLHLGLACYLAWCSALLPRTWYARHGIGRALQLCAARICRERWSAQVAVLAAVGALAITFTWSRGGDSWQGLLTALVGLAVGGGLIWGVRIIGSAALGREAMGFGDVILLAMIGAFLGWQPVLFAFFLSPFAGIVLGLFQFLVKGDNSLPFGPFLCVGAIVTVMFWVPLWTAVATVFAPGFLVPGAMAVCLLLTGVLLLLLRAVKAAFSRSRAR